MDNKPPQKSSPAPFPGLPYSTTSPQVSYNIGTGPQLGQRRGYEQLSQQIPNPAPTPSFYRPPRQDQKSPISSQFLPNPFIPQPKPKELFKEEQKISELNVGIRKVALTKQSEEMRGFREALVLMSEFLEIDEKYVDLVKELELLPDKGAYLFGPKELIQKTTLKIPSIILTQYNSKKDRKFCLSGIWPEIHRVFITLDSKLFLWNFLNPDDIIEIEPCQYPIESILLTSPPINLLHILPANIKFVIWIATEIEIRLYALETEPNISLINTEFYISSEGDRINKIIKTPNGRIFYGGIEGNLHELKYHEKNSWFYGSRTGKMVKKDHTGSWLKSLIPSIFSFGTRKFAITRIKIDKTRNVLYTMQEGQDPKTHKISDTFIGVYDLGEYGTDFSEIVKIRKIDLWSMRINQENGYKNENIQIAEICPIERIYSENIQLMVMLTNGIRIYLSFNTMLRSYTRENLPNFNEYQKSVFSYNKKFLNTYSIITIYPPQTIKNNPDEIIEIPSGLDYPESFKNIGLLFKSIDNRQFLIYDQNFDKTANCLISINCDESALAGIRTLAHQPLRGHLREIGNILDNSEAVITDISENLLENKLDKSIVELLGFLPNIQNNPVQVNFIENDRHGFSMCCMHNLAKNVYIPISEYYVLTSLEFKTFIKIRAIDKIAEMLFNDAANNILLEKLIRQYGKSEICALLLQILCNPAENYYINSQKFINSPDQPSENIQIIKLDKKLLEKARRLFFEIGNIIDLGEEQKFGDFYTNPLNIFGDRNSRIFY